MRWSNAQSFDSVSDGHGEGTVRTPSRSGASNDATHGVGVNVEQVCGSLCAPCSVPLSIMNKLIFKHVQIQEKGNMHMKKNQSKVITGSMPKSSDPSVQEHRALGICACRASLPAAFVRARLRSVAWHSTSPHVACVCARSIVAQQKHVGRGRCARNFGTC